MEIKFYGAFALNRLVDLHAIGATPARWRGDAGSSPLDAPDALVDFHTGNCLISFSNWPLYVLSCSSDMALMSTCCCAMLLWKRWRFTVRGAVVARGRGGGVWQLAAALRTAMRRGSWISEGAASRAFNRCLQRQLWLGSVQGLKVCDFEPLDFLSVSTY